MATSGSNTTWSSNGGHYIKVTWSETSQSTVNNRSAVTVNMYFGSKSGWSISDSSNSYSLTIDGTTYSGSNTSLSHTGGEELVMSESVMIYHNSDGTRSFSMKGSISGLYFGGITGSTFSGTLDTIPRTSTMTSTANMTAGWSKTFSISRASSSFNHKLYIYLTKSGVADDYIRVENFSTSETSRTVSWTDSELVDIYNNGHGYWTGTKVLLITYSGTTEIGRNEYTGTLDWPSNNSSATMANSINVGDSFDIAISKASSLYSHEAKLTLTDGTSLATQGITTGSSFSLTPNATTIYQNTASSTSISVELWIRTVLTAGTSTEVRGWTKEKTSTVYIQSTPPTLGTMSYTELETTVATAIGSSGTNPPLVQNKSRPRFTFTAATPKNYATITNYTVSIGGSNLSRTTAGSVDFGVLNVSANTNATLTVTDSRGFTSSLSIPVTYLAYSNPSVTMNAKRLNGFGDTVELTGSATVSSLNGQNIMSTSSGFKYRYRQLPSGTFTSYTNASSVNAGTISTMNKVSLTLSNENSYEFEFVVTDELGSTTVLKTAGAGRPIVFIDDKLLSVGINRFPTEAGQFEVQDKMMLFPTTGTTTKTASIFTTNTNKSYIHFKATTSSNDPGYIMHETSSTAADQNKGVLHLCPSDDNDNVNDYVTIHGTNDPETIKLYTGGDASFSGTVTADTLSATTAVSTNKISIPGSLLTVDGTYAEMARFVATSGQYAYTTWYQGGTRIGYLGSVSAGSTSFKIHSDGGWLDISGASGINNYVGGSSRLLITGTTTTSYNNLDVQGTLSTTGNVTVGGTLNAGSGSVEGSLIHNSGYMHIQVFNTGSSHYSSASTSTSRGEMYYSGASNNRVIFIARRNDGTSTTTSVQASAFPTSSSIRYKEAVEEYKEDALQKILETGIKTYRLKGHEIGARKVGVIIEHGVPEEIVEITRDAIDPYSMTAMSWKAIQQLGHELFVKEEEIKGLYEEKDSMKKEIEDLREMVTMLMGRVNALEGGN